MHRTTDSLSGGCQASAVCSASRATTHRFSRTIAIHALFVLFLGLWLALEPLPSYSYQSSQPETGTAGAQQVKDSGRIAGTVKDPHQALVAGAKVTLSSQQPRLMRNTVTDGQGAYEFSSLPDAVYSLKIDVPGFKTQTVPEITIASSASVTQDVALGLGGASESITVNALTLDTDVKTQQQAALLDLPEGVASDNIEFTAKDIENLHPASLLDVLQQVPGLAVSFQGRQHMDFASMRGGSFQIILDGVYMSQTDRLLATLPVQLVESMTIVRDSTALSIGPLAALLGQTMGGVSNGMANQGFVIIRTKRAAGNDGGFVADGGNFGTALGQVYLGSKTGNWDYRGAYTYYNTEGKDNWNMQARNGSATFHGGYTSSKLTMDFMYYGSRGMRNMEYGEVLSSATFGSCTPKATQVGALCPTALNIYKLDGDLFAFNAVRHWNDKNRTVLQYGFDRLSINSGMSPTHTAIPTNEQDSTEGDFVLKHTYLLKGNALTGGGQWVHYIAPLGSAPVSGSHANRTDQIMARWFAQDDYHLMDNRLVLDGGIRGDKVHNGNYNSTLKKPSDIWLSTFKTLGFGATYKITPTVNVAARYGLVTTPPPSNYVFQTSTMTAPSSNLPNQTQNRGELSSNDNINPHFNPRVSIYIYDTTNGTASASTCTSPADATPPNKKNSSSWLNASGNEIDCVSIVGDVKTAGTEVGFSGRLMGPFSYSTGYGYVGTDNTAVNKTMSHNFVNAQLNYHQKNWFGNFSMVYVGPLWSSASPGGTYYGELANYSRLDGNAGYNFMLFGKQMSFTAYERNLNDNNYATRYVTGAYRDPGRQYGVELAGKVF